MRHFSEVLSIEGGRVESEGMIPYEALTAACLAQGVMPAVVPQLKTITLGGAVAGVGIESSSHRHGLVHDTMLELEVLLGDGRTVVCTADNEHADLFYGFPNSYGTLGYALRVKARTVPVKPYVRLAHRRYADADRYFSSLKEALENGEADFIDGTIFAPDRLFITLGRFSETAPYTSDYTFEHIYYRSIGEKREDYLTTHDYVWRWDTDWFWCSKNVFAQNTFLRKFAFGKKRLGSRTYTKIMRWNSRVGVTARIERLLGLHSESVIQDVDIPLARAAEFLDFYAREIALWPMWTCPIGPGTNCRLRSVIKSCIRDGSVPRKATMIPIPARPTTACVSLSAISISRQSLTPRSASSRRTFDSRDSYAASDSSQRKRAFSMEKSLAAARKYGFSSAARRMAARDCQEAGDTLLKGMIRAQSRGRGADLLAARGVVTAMSDSYRRSLSQSESRQ